MQQCFFTKDKTGQEVQKRFLNQNMKMHDKAHIPAFYHRLILQAYPSIFWGWK